jgi:hypothetical protein
MIATIADAADSDNQNLIFSICKDILIVSAFIFFSRHYNMFTPPPEDDNAIPLIASLTIIGLMIGYHFLQ